VKLLNTVLFAEKPTNSAPFLSEANQHSPFSFRNLQAQPASEKLADTVEGTLLSEKSENSTNPRSENKPTWKSSMVSQRRPWGCLRSLLEKGCL
jgi:hypothetical protein